MPPLLLLSSIRPSFSAGVMLPKGDTSGRHKHIYWESSVSSVEAEKPGHGKGGACAGKQSGNTDSPTSEIHTPQSTLCLTLHQSSQPWYDEHRKT